VGKSFDGVSGGGRDRHYNLGRQLKEGRDTCIAGAGRFPPSRCIPAIDYGREGGEESCATSSRGEGKSATISIWWRRAASYLQGCSI